MVVIHLNVYLPENVKGKYLFGCKTVKESKETACTKTFLNYYVIAADDVKKHSDLECLGTCETLSTFNKTQSSKITNSKNTEFNFITDEDSNKVIKVRINGKELPETQDSTNSHHISLFYYEQEKFRNTYSEVHQQSNVDSNFALFIAKALRDKHTKEVGETALERFSNKSHKTLVTFAAASSKVLAPFSSIFDNTAIYRHCRNWRKCLNDDHSRNGFVVLDVVLGVLFFLFMHHIQDSGRYFMDLTEIIVGKLRGLLEMLDGSPVGLKLNVQLNNFLLSCFMYHVDLWFNFIVIVEPAIHYLFLPITIFGFFGFTFQCALLCDIVTLITLHAHCFYIYAAMLYKLELSSIRSLLRIVLGRRLNVLKDRVESQNYTNRQLFLATLFFTTLLFILPTVLIYYLVFASLRLSIYCVSYILMKIQYKILTFPFYKYLRWIMGSYIDATNISISFTSSERLENYELTEFKLHLNRSLPWNKSIFAAKTESQLPKPLAVGSFALCLVKGELMAFLPNI